MSSKVRMALIATYPKLSEVYRELTNSRDSITAYNVYASFESAANIAREMEDDLDVILSRGGTAEYIRKAVHIPVLSIPITPFDVIKALHSLSPLPEKVALIQYRKNVRDIQEIAKMFGTSIKEYTFIRQQDIQDAVEDAAENGITTIIGGHVAVETAIRKGLSGIELSAGEEAMDRVIDEAIEMQASLRSAQYQSTCIRHTLNSLIEGIVVTDTEKRIITINKAAGNLFLRRYRKGDLAGPDILSKECIATYTSQKEQPGYIRVFHKETYSVSHIPIFHAETFLGVVSRYEDITKTEALEQKVRKEIQAKGFEAQYHFADILAEEPCMTTVKEQAKIYALTDSAILVQGESGTGKELFAQSIHNESSRRKGPFVAVNCAAIPPTLLESELFGYEKGAFTGAQKNGKPGFFELAHMGTLFLDEIGEVSMEVQTRLLRVLQEREIMRVGGDKIIPVNVRIISATNKDLEKEVKNGRFRRDLYYRLNILELHIPPLRNRPGDIWPMAVQFASVHDLDLTGNTALMSKLNAYTWPGNVRELRNIIERYCVLFPFWKQGTLKEDALIGALGIHSKHTVIPHDKQLLENTPTGEELLVSLPEGKPMSEIIAHVEYILSSAALKKYGNNPDEAARALGIGRTTLWRKSRSDPFSMNSSEGGDSE